MRALVRESDEGMWELANGSQSLRRNLLKIVSQRVVYES
jgi:hypothetical protein